MFVFTNEEVDTLADFVGYKQIGKYKYFVIEIYGNMYRFNRYENGNHYCYKIGA